MITLRLFFLPYPHAGLIKSLWGSQSWRQCRQPYLLGLCPKPRGSRRTFVLLRRPAEAGFYRAIQLARPPLAPVGAVVIGLVIGNKMQNRALSVPNGLKNVPLGAITADIAPSVLYFAPLGAGLQADERAGG